MKASPDRYLNRELSWLQFNERVLYEAASARVPLLERLRYLAIFESNLDEFYMVRVSGLIEQFESGVISTSPDGLSPNDQLKVIADVANPMRNRAARILTQELLPELEREGIHLRSFAELTERQRRDVTRYFQDEVFPLCTPLILHPAHTVPFISSGSLNIAVELRDERGELRLGRVKVPPVIPRAIRLGKRKNEFLLLEDLIAANIQSLFAGVEIEGCHLFRVIRDADMEIRELDAADLISNIEESVRLRRFGDPVLLEVQQTAPAHVRQLLMAIHQLDAQDVLSIDGMLGFEVLWDIALVDRPNLRFPPYIGSVPEPISHTASMFEAIRQKDILLHHPFDGFRSVEEFISSAVTDPDVIGIKQTLYRVGKESPVVESLLTAANEGKQVAVMVELKARFDESNNITWARQLERAGVHVTYGFMDLKTHCKLCLIVRREGKGVKQYAHIATGNYNPTTARSYTDIGLLTADPDITQDIAELFNYLTGFSRQTKYRKLLVAPVNLREGILNRIRRETRFAKRGKSARIILKLNALVDPEVIDALYEASQAGVIVDCIVRGVCSLRPGVDGLSKNIRVISIIGRFLEHSRVYWFRNGGEFDVLIGSADAMRRNLDRRVEALCPVEDPDLIDLIRVRILEPCLKDNVGAWALSAAGTYAKVTAAKGEAAFEAQEWFMRHPLGAAQFGATPRKKAHEKGSHAL